MIKHTFKIEGLHCEKCDAKLIENIRDSVKVKSVTSSFEKGEAIVICKDDVDVLNIKKVIVGLGHKILDTQSEPYAEEKKTFFSLFKKH